MQQNKLLKNKSFDISFDLEKDLLDRNITNIAGIDEAGRGSLAGPLSIGCVVFPVEVIKNPPAEFELINDSKKITSKKRIIAKKLIEEYALFSSVKFVSPEKIDELNINQATKYGIELLLQEAPLAIDYLLIDGNFKFQFPVKAQSVIKGDLRSYSIAAASICAKVIRDDYMIKLAEEYPLYGFEKNVGYGTAQHRTAILENGPISHHRKTYEPVKSMLR